MVEKGWLPSNCGDEPVDIYVNTVKIIKVVPEFDDIETIMSEIAPLCLNNNAATFSLFREGFHTKYHVRSVLTPRMFLEKGESCGTLSYDSLGPFVECLMFFWTFRWDSCSHTSICF